MKDLYGILGVDRGATPTEIKRAYRRVSKRLHPDTGGSREAFNELNVAYNVLRNSISRNRYDATGSYDAGSVLNGDAQVRGIIADALAVVLTADVDLLGSDLIAEMVKMVRTELKPLEKKLNVIERMLTRAKRLEGRFTPKAANGVDYIAPTLEGHGRQASEAQHNLRIQISIRQKAIEVLKGYRFDPEKGGAMMPSPFSTYR